MHEPWNRDGYYVVLPSSRTLLECEFVHAEREPPFKVLQELVGGWIEHVTLPSGASAYVNEEGKLEGLPFNPLATALYANPNDSICGTMVVLCGKASGEEDEEV